MKESQYGPCGLFCEACGATDCGGCRSDMIDDYITNCTFRKCSGEKGIEFCCFCEEYPCDELHAFMTDEWPHHHTMAPNLAFISEHGAAKWIEAQRREWTCAECGERLIWYQKQCVCGRTLDAWEPPM